MSTKSGRVRTIAYWALTGIVAWEMVAGSLWDLLQIEFTRVNMTHLGYPMYFTIITGLWKVPAGPVLLLPRLPRLKEWTYAGMLFTYTGAVASHLAVGDRPMKWVFPLVFAAFTVGSWLLRPPARRLASPEPQPPVRLAAWLVPLGVSALFFVLAALTLPKGAPPP